MDHKPHAAGRPPADAQQADDPQDMPYAGPGRGALGKGPCAQGAMRWQSQASESG